MSKLDEIAGQGPVAEVTYEKGLTYGNRSTLPNGTKLYTTDPAPLVALIRQLGDALEDIRRITCEPRIAFHASEALTALEAFDKGE